MKIRATATASLILSCFIALSIFASCNDGKTPTAPDTSTGVPEIDALLKQVEKSPNDPILFAQLSRAYYNNDAFDEAIQSVQKAIQLDSSQPVYFHLLADIYLNYNRSYDALLTAQRASGLFPDSVSTLLNLAEIQMILEQYQPSIQTTKRVLAVQPTSNEAFYMLGMNYKYLGDTLKALQSFQEAVNRNEDHLFAYQELAMLCDAQRKDDLAIQYFNNALRIDSTDHYTLFNLGNFYQRRRKDNDAVYWFQKDLDANRRHPNPDFSIARTFFNIGIIYLDHDSLQTAYNNFNIAANEEPEFDKAYYYRGLTAEKMGDQQGAIQDYKQALAFNPDNKKAEQALQQLSQ